MIKVSIIIPTHNRPHKLKIAVDSALDQGLKEIEIIIIDDASELSYQPTIDEIAASNPSIRLFRQSANLGVASARNLGIEKSIGEYLLFLDDDDELLPDMISRSLKEVVINDYDATSCKCEIVGEHLPATKIRRYKKSSEARKHLYTLEKNPEAHIFLSHPQIHTFLIRKNAIESIRFVVDQNYGEDLWFWMDLARQGLKFKKLDFVGSVYHIHKSSTSYAISYEQKLKYYKASLRKFQHNALLQNICWIKMAAIGFRKDDPRTFLWLVRSMIRPLYFIRHARHYLGLIF